MKLQEITQVRTGENYFSSVEDFLVYREQMRSAASLSNAPGSREQLMAEGIIVSENFVLDEDGKGYTRTRVWRSPDDYQVDPVFLQVTQPYGWTITSIGTSEIPD